VIKKIKLLAVGILLLPAMMLGQKDFVIDSARILSNENWSEFVHSLKTDSFEIFTDKAAIPGFVKKELHRLAHGFSIANPHEPYQCCCTSPDHLPARQLSFLAKSKDVLVMTYKTGGIGVSLHLLMIRFENNEVVDLWSGYCWADVKSVGDVLWFIEESKKPPVPGRRRPAINGGVVIL
jgi:hypothetical protein